MSYHQILSKSVSDILYGCEGLWELVKNKSIGSNEKKIPELKDEIIEDISKKRRIIETHDDEWFFTEKDLAFQGLKNLGINKYMEIKSKLIKKDNYFENEDLLKSARDSQIHTFGWPIGVFADIKDYSPKPRKEGITAKISINTDNDTSFDYWSLRQNGDFYLLKSLFEDKRKPDTIFFNTRIVRITETLLYLRNLYSNLGVDNNQIIEITIKHGGLKDCVLGVAGGRRMLFENHKIEESEVSSTVRTNIKDIDINTVDVVESFTKTLFEMFKFFKLDRNVLEDIVNKYIKGETS